MLKRFDDLIGVPPLVADEVKNFYNKFAKESLSEDFSNFNKRQYAIKKLIDRFAKKNSVILEIGCGAGVVTRHLLSYTTKLLALDISDKNIEIARKYVNSDKVKFYVADVSNDELEFMQDQKFDLVLMADVIEHIPKGSHSKLFERIENHLNESGVFILSYPTPEYQQYLMTHKHIALQIIDQKLELTEIISKTNLKPFYFGYQNIWSENQYIHLVLKKNISYSDVDVKEGLLTLFRLRFNKYFWYFKNIAFRRKLNRIINKV